MLTKEYRIPMPLTVEEYRIAQLYMIQVCKIFIGGGFLPLMAINPCNLCYFAVVVCLFVCGYPSSSLGWRYGMNGNSGSCCQLN